MANHTQTKQGGMHSWWQ